MQKGKQILSPEKFRITLARLASQVIENYDDKAPLYIIGIQEKGVVLAERIIEILKAHNTKQEFHLGKLDITFYRDDFRMRDKPLSANSTDIDFDIDSKNILLVDDVLYTGRTIHAAISALQDLGRVSRIELLTMVDRRYKRHFPIVSDYTGMQVDALDDAYVRVQWAHLDGDDKVLIFSAQKNAQ